jgi:hypothetical protein
MTGLPCAHALAIALFRASDTELTLPITASACKKLNAAAPAGVSVSSPGHGSRLNISVERKALHAVAAFIRRHEVDHRPCVPLRQSKINDSICGSNLEAHVLCKLLNPEAKEIDPSRFLWDKAAESVPAFAR